MDISGLRIGKIEVDKMMFGFTTGILVGLSVHLENEEGSGMARCNVEVTLEHKDWTISELKAAAIDQAYRVFETVVSHRHE